MTGGADLDRVEARLAEHRTEALGVVPPGPEAQHAVEGWQPPEGQQDRPQVVETGPADHPAFGGGRPARGLPRLPRMRRRAHLSPTTPLHRRPSVPALRAMMNVAGPTHNRGLCCSDI